MEVGYADGIRVKSLPHGESRKRFYINRGDIVRRHRYAPLQHVERDEAGMLQWSCQASRDFKRDIKQYFFNRDEDA